MKGPGTRIKFPVAIDDATSMPDPTQYDTIDNPNVRHDEVETRQNNAIKALQRKVGINESRDPNSVECRVRRLEGIALLFFVAVAVAVAVAAVAVGFALLR